MVRPTPRPLFIPGKDPVPVVQEAGWALGPVWTGAENLAPTRIRSPDRPAHLDYEGGSKWILDKKHNAELDGLYSL